MANRIEWDDALYSVGIRKMDEQHKQLVALINALDAKKGTGDREFVEKILNTLVQYTLNHFSDEEKILKRMHYSSYAEHESQHKKFIEAVGKARKDFDFYGGSPEMLEKLLKMLTDWLLQHILVQDRAYGEFLVK